MIDNTLKFYRQSADRKHRTKRNLFSGTKNICLERPLGDNTSLPMKRKLKLFRGLKVTRSERCWESVANNNSVKHLSRQ